MHVHALPTAVGDRKAQGAARRRPRAERAPTGKGDAGRLQQGPGAGQPVRQPSSSPCCPCSQNSPLLTVRAQQARAGGRRRGQAGALPAAPGAAVGHGHAGPAAGALQAQAASCAPRACAGGWPRRGRAAAPQRQRRAAALRGLGGAGRRPAGAQRAAHSGGGAGRPRADGLPAVTGAPTPRALQKKHCVTYTSARTALKSMHYRYDVSHPRKSSQVLPVCNRLHRSSKGRGGVRESTGKRHFPIVAAGKMRIRQEAPGLHCSREQACGCPAACKVHRQAIWPAIRLA